MYKHALDVEKKIVKYVKTEKFILKIFLSITKFLIALYNEYIFLIR